MPQRQFTLFRKISSSLLVLVLIMQSAFPYETFAQDIFNLSPPGSIVGLSPVFEPAVLKGVRIDVDNPFAFDFIVDIGHSDLQGQALKEESQKLIKYFLAALTIPEEDLWVNLSPHEPQRITTPAFGKTEMGRDLLAQDYLLKQLTSSLLYPEEETGEAFWEKVYSRVYQKYGSVEISPDIFHKVWITPKKTVVYENNSRAYISESRMQVLLEEDYMSRENHLDVAENSSEKDLSISKEVMQEIILPLLDKEIHEGENFYAIRQIFNSLILAKWFKIRLKKTLLGQVYVDQAKIQGVDAADPEIREKIYQQYLKAFRQGAFDYIKEEYDPLKKEIIPRHYFAGGTSWKMQEGEDLFLKEVDPSRQEDFVQVVEKRPGLVLIETLFHDAKKKNKKTILASALSLALSVSPQGGAAKSPDDAERKFFNKGSAYSLVQEGKKENNLTLVKKTKKENLPGLFRDLKVRSGYYSFQNFHLRGWESWEGVHTVLLRALQPQQEDHRWELLQKIENSLKGGEMLSDDQVKYLLRSLDYESYLQHKRQADHGIWIPGLYAQIISKDSEENKSAVDSIEKAVPSYPLEAHEDILRSLYRYHFAQRVKNVLIQVGPRIVPFFTPKNISIWESRFKKLALQMPLSAEILSATKTETAVEYLYGLYSAISRMPNHFPNAKFLKEHVENAIYSMGPMVIKYLAQREIAPHIKKTHLNKRDVILITSAMEFFSLFSDDLGEQAFEALKDILRQTNNTHIATEAIASMHGMNAPQTQTILKQMLVEHKDARVRKLIKSRLQDFSDFQWDEWKSYIKGKFTHFSPVEFSTEIMVLIFLLPAYAFRKKIILILLTGIINAMQNPSEYLLRWAFWLAIKAPHIDEFSRPLLIKHFLEKFDAGPTWRIVLSPKTIRTLGEALSFSFDDININKNILQLLHRSLHPEALPYLFKALRMGIHDDLRSKTEKAIAEILQALPHDNLPPEIFQEIVGNSHEDLLYCFSNYPVLFTYVSDWEMKLSKVKVRTEFFPAFDFFRLMVSTTPHYQRIANQRLGAAQWKGENFSEEDDFLKFVPEDIKAASRLIFEHMPMEPDILDGYQQFLKFFQMEEGDSQARVLSFLTLLGALNVQQKSMADYYQMNQEFPRAQELIDKYGALLNDNEQGALYLYIMQAWEDGDLDKVITEMDSSADSLESRENQFYQQIFKILQESWTWEVSDDFKKSFNFVTRYFSYSQLFQYLGSHRDARIEYLYDFLEYAGIGKETDMVSLGRSIEYWLSNFSRTSGEEEAEYSLLGKVINISGINMREDMLNHWEPLAQMVYDIQTPDIVTAVFASLSKQVDREIFESGLIGFWENFEKKKTEFIDSFGDAKGLKLFVRAMNQTTEFGPLRIYFPPLAENLLRLNYNDAKRFIAALADRKVTDPSDLDSDKIGSFAWQYVMEHTEMTPEKARSIWNEVHPVINQGIKGFDRNALIRGVYAASFLFDENEIVPKLWEGVIREISDGIKDEELLLASIAIYTMGTVSADPQLSFQIKTRLRAWGVSENENFWIQEGLRRLEQKRIMGKVESKWVNELTAQVLKAYNEGAWALTELLGENEGNRVDEYIREQIINRLDTKGGLPYIVPELSLDGKTGMGIFRSVLFPDAFENYLEDGHQRSEANRYQGETYVGVTKEKAEGYGGINAFWAIMPAIAYNRRVLQKKIILGTRTSVELVLDDDIPRDEMRVILVTRSQIETLKEGFLESQKNLSVLKEINGTFEYYPNGLKEASTKVNGDDVLIKLLESHKEMTSPRLLVILDIDQDSDDQIYHFLLNNPVFSKVFPSNDRKRMKAVSIESYTREFIESYGAQILKARLARRRRQLEAGIESVQHLKANETEGSQKAAFVWIGGEKYYAKFYKNEDRMRAEWLTWLAFREAGIPVTEEMHVIEVDGEMAIISKWFEGAVAAGSESYRESLLALEHVMGILVQDRDRGKQGLKKSTSDNYLLVNGQVIPIDFGGSAMFRSTGGIKGEGKDEIDQLPFGVENFLNMLSTDGAHRKKAFYQSLRYNERSIQRAMVEISHRLGIMNLSTLIKAVGFKNQEIEHSIHNVYIESLRIIHQRAINQIGEDAQLQSIPLNVNRSRQVLMNRTASAQQVWKAVEPRVKSIPSLDIIMKEVNSNRTSFRGIPDDILLEHTHDVFISLNTASAEKKVNLGHYSFFSLLRAAAIFHDTGKFVSHFLNSGQKEKLQGLFDMIAEETKDTRWPQDWEAFMRAVKGQMDNPGDHGWHEKISLGLMVLMLPKFGFDRTEIELAYEILDKDKIGLMSESRRYAMKKFSIKKMDNMMTLPRSLYHVFPNQRRWTLTRQILELSKTLFEADTQISKGIRSQVLRQKADNTWEIREGAMPKWDQYYAHVLENARREQALMDYLQQVEDSNGHLNPLDLRRKISMIAIDFDDTVSIKGEHIDLRILSSLRASLEAGIKVVIISGTNIERIKRKLNFDKLSAVAQSNLTIIGRWRYERFSNGRYTTKPSMSETEKNRLRKALRNKFPSGTFKVKQSRHFLKMGINSKKVSDVPATMALIENIEEFKNYRIFLTRGNILHIVPEDKGDILKEEVENNHIDPQELLVIADDLGPFASDNSMAKAFQGEALVANVGAYNSHQQEGSTMLTLHKRYDGGTQTLLSAIDPEAKEIDLNGIFENIKKVEMRIGKKSIIRNYHYVEETEEHSRIKVKATDVSQEDNALVTEKKDKDSYGGVDFRGSGMDVEIQGQGETLTDSYQLPVDIDQWHQIPGISVYISNISLRVDVLNFLGLVPNI